MTGCSQCALDHIKALQKSIFVLSLVFLIGLVPTVTHTFQLDPYSTLNAETGKFVRVGLASKIPPDFLPIHERLTLQAVSDARIDDAYKTNAFITGLIEGVRWNDDPLRMATKRPLIWLASYKHSCLSSQKIGPDWDLLYRTHCGDMQFLHAMASSSTECAGDTISKILMWTEFAYQVASGKISKHWRFRSMSKFLEPESAKLFSRLLTMNGKRGAKWHAEWLFTRVCTRVPSLGAIIPGRRPTDSSCIDTKESSSPQLIQDIALGSLIHVLQDSFSRSHVLRENSRQPDSSMVIGVGKIVQFGNYRMQNSDLHEKADTNLIESGPSDGYNLKEVTSRLIELAVQQRLDKRDRWSEARAILAEVLSVVKPEVTPGDLGYR